MTRILLIVALVVGATGNPGLGHIRIGKVLIKVPTCTITSPTSWPAVVEGTSAPQVTIGTEGCKAPVACTVTTGALPTGIIESSECVYSDDPAAAHTASSTNITITATDDLSRSDPHDYSIVIAAP